MKRAITLSAVAALSLFAFFLYAGTLFAPKTSDSATLTVAGAAIHVSLATSTEARERGLSGRDGLGANEGMLFVFPEEGVYRFWMKEMRFSIDIIWLSATGEVIYIEHSLAPSTYPNSYGPTTPARYVLEVPAGFALSHGLHIGDRVTL